MPVSIVCVERLVFLIGLQAYHSALNEDPDARQVGNMSILPIKTRIRGPAPVGTHSRLHVVTHCNGPPRQPTPLS
jgi:ARP2/3 complex ARPC3 (21 kDa) subunit